MAKSTKIRLADVLKAITARTEGREITWTQANYEAEPLLAAEIGTVRITLGPVTYKRGTGTSKDMKLSIFNQDGDETDSIRDTQIDDELLPAGEVSWWTYMLRLYNTARRQVLGSDDVLDQLSAELGID